MITPSFHSQVVSTSEFKLDRFPYGDEESILWLSNPTFFPFVRERRIWCASRSAKPASWRLPSGLLGYSNLRPDAKSNYANTFLRRCWYRASHDSDYGMRGYAPMEGVNPRTIRAGFPSHKPKIIGNWPLILYRDDEWPDIFQPKLENWQSDF